MNEANMQLIECKVAGRIAKICERLREDFARDEISMHHFVKWIWYLSVKFGFTYFEDYHTPPWVYGVMNRYWTWEHTLKMFGEQETLEDFPDFEGYLRGYCEGLADATYSTSQDTSSSSENIFLHPVPKDYEFTSAIAVRVK